MSADASPMVPGSPPAARRLLGTFGGVFTPSILTILGIILFRRLGYVVGAAGLLQALGMLALVTLVAAAQDILLRTDGEDLLPPAGQT